ncbi:MAG: phospho-sugar mutase [Flammeovirgaceae bacterium]|nr:phospho-sugar mutase [Flammeovirgaceae bacterium]
MTADEKAKSWLNSSKLKTAARAQILLLKENKAEFEEAFYKDLVFGTGGLRGLMGIGSNRINEYTVGMATQGFSNYLKIAFPNEKIKVAIAYDSRNNAAAFADVTASVFSANDITVYLFKELRPTPILTYAVRQLGCHGGVVLTASHNPKEYNGYKAYWNDGAQLISPHDDLVIQQVQAIASIDDVQFKKNSSLIHKLDETIDEQYLAMIADLSLRTPAENSLSDLKIVFSPIHGTGITLVPQILKNFGFNQVYVVAEQAQPDGDFPTVIYPNPEEAEALTLALKMGKELDADLVLATDPDADRVGIAAKNDAGVFELLNGNQTGALLIYYLLSKWKEQGKLTGAQYVVKTIVTTELIQAIATGFGVICLDTLTGFKYIAEKIHELEGKMTFIGGGEESYGYLIGDQVRDKDAIMSCAIIAELTAWAKANHKTLFDLLIDMALQFGLYQEGLLAITKKGKKGAEEIQQIMSNFRMNPPLSLDGIKVISMLDYQFLTHKNLIDNTVIKLEGHESNVLQFMTADGSKISIRPSGTEPKIKIYFSVNTSLNNRLYYQDKVTELRNKIEKLSIIVRNYFG